MPSLANESEWQCAANIQRPLIGAIPHRNRSPKAPSRLAGNLISSKPAGTLQPAITD